MVDLFAGPGGLDLAAEVLGIESVGVEIDASACRTREAAGLETEAADVRERDPEHPRLLGRQILAGGPPCQTFTVAGNGVGRRALEHVLKFVQRLVNREDPAAIRADLQSFDQRTGLVLEPLRWALKAIDLPELDPYEAIVLEQVPAVLPVWEAYAEALKAEGYAVAHGILHTEEFGVPQTRRRAVLIARWQKRHVALPAPTHHRYRKGTGRPSGDLVRQSWVAMEDVLPHRKRPPFRVVSNYGTGGDPKARGRRRSCEPAATVTGKISRNRIVLDGEVERELPRFTESEAGVLQTFPVAYPWRGQAIAQQIGNAVPPRLGMHILCAALDLGIPAQDALERLEKWTPPSPAAIGADTDRTLELVGEPY